MPDGIPPEIGELFRAINQLRADQKDGFAQINQRLDKVVSVDVHEGNNRRLDERLKDLADDISAERTARIEAMTIEVKRREEDSMAHRERMDKLTSNMRWVMVSLVIPVGLFLANLWLVRGTA